MAIERMSKVFGWRQKAPYLAELSEEVSDMLDAHARVMNLAKGARLFASETSSDSLVLPISGSIRVQGASAAKSVTKLCRLRESEGAALALAWKPSHGTSGFEVIADTEVEVLIVPRATFEAIMSSSQEIRASVFDACSHRITELLDMIENAVLTQFARQAPQRTHTISTHRKEHHHECQRRID